MQNGHKPNLPDLVMNDLMKFVINNDDLIRDISVEFPPEVDRMIARRQRQIAATFAKGTPSLEWLVRRRQFTSLWLQYACLPDAEKDAFCDGLVEWWKLVCANEQRAAEHIAQHKARRLA